ncbi:MAG: hypothetical protein HKL98_05110 [Burkholderiales bacterium]|nr:hypothetical protein [Burkholderiales bacterium]
MRKFLFIFLFLAQAADAAGLGRLFFTPEERASLEAGHSSPAGTLPGKEGWSRSPATGKVEMKGGGRTVWENGIPKHLEAEKKK